MLDTLAIWSLGALLAVWVGYPLVIGAIAALRPERAPDGGQVPAGAVSVVIVSRETPEAVAARVNNCLATSGPLTLEVVVALDREGFQSRRDALARLVPGARIVPADAAGGKAAGLNAAMRAATGDVVVFADTHQRFEPSTIPALIQALSNPQFAAVSGALVLPANTPPLVHAYWTCERWLRRMEARVHSTIGVTGAVYAMRRAHWAPLPEGLLLDDVYVPMRLVLQRRRVGFAADAIAVETRVPEPGLEYRRKVRTLTGVLQLCAWLPAVLLPWRNPVWVQFVFHKLLRLITPYLLLVLGVWALARVVQIPWPFGPLALATSGLAAVWLWRARSTLAARLRGITTEALLLQVAALKAGWNGLRGQWNVWDA